MRHRLFTCLVVATLLSSCGSKSHSAAPAVNDNNTTTTAQRPVTPLAWTSIAQTTQAGLEATSGSVDGKLYTFGGYFNKTFLATNIAQVYDPTSNAWTTLAPTPRPFSHTAIAADGDNFILAGGNSADAKGNTIYATDNVWEYNTNTNTYTSLPSLPGSRAGGGMGKVGDTLHFFGGVDTTRKEQKTHWTLDLDNVADGWKQASDFPYPPRTHFATISIGDDIYILGGLVGINQDTSDFADVYKYDTVSDTWTVLASMPLPLSHMSDSTVVWGGRIWVFGGEKAYNVTQKETLVYDIASNTWATNTDLPEPRFAGNAMVVDGTFYYIRGSMANDFAWKAKEN